jgi:hypothetical protein
MCTTKEIKARFQRILRTHEIRRDDFLTFLYDPLSYEVKTSVKCMRLFKSVLSEINEQAPVAETLVTLFDFYDLYPAKYEPLVREVRDQLLREFDIYVDPQFIPFAVDKMADRIHALKISLGYCEDKNGNIEKDAVMMNTFRVYRT